MLLFLLFVFELIGTWHLQSLCKVGPNIISCNAISHGMYSLIGNPAYHLNKQFILNDMIYWRSNEYNKNNNNNNYYVSATYFVCYIYTYIYENHVGGVIRLS